MLFGWRAALVALGVCVAVYALLWTIGTRRTKELRSAAAVARTAVVDARSAGAMTWAPDELHAAEVSFNAALVAQRLEETRLWPVPNAKRVAAMYAEAGRLAAGASRLTGARSASAVASTTALLRDARTAVEASGELASRIHLGADRRTLLARANVALNEAVVYERAGDFSTATVRARQASELAAQVRDHAAAVAARYADAETLMRWRRWRDETLASSRREGHAAIVVVKEAHTLTLFLRGEPVRTYRVDLGFNWIADKSHSGDGATPEGRYRVVARKAHGASIYHKALLLDYPNNEDRAEFSRAVRSGNVPKAATIGGLIEIHGEGGRGRDWTKGCVALTNTEIDELFARVGVGTPVTIVGSDNYGAIAELGGQGSGVRPGQPR